MAKTILLVLSFLLVNSLLCFGLPDPVLDTAGNELRAGNSYYIVSTITGAGGGGVTLGHNLNGSLCPLIVDQEPFDVRYGLPVSFTSVDPDDGVIRVSTDTNFRFDVPSFCRHFNVWTVDYARQIGQYVIATNGVLGNPGPDTISNWFKIEKQGIAYRISHCPTLCEDCRPINCMGVSVDSRIVPGRRILTLSSENQPFLVQFVKTD